MQLSGGSAISVSGLEPVGRGLDRPEHVLVTPEGRVLASDRASAVAEVRADGTLGRLGAAGGEPNGFDVTADGAAVVANFGHGRVQRVDLSSGHTTTLVQDQVDGHPLRYANCAVVDSTGTIWVSVSTREAELGPAIVDGRPDGYIFRMDPDGSSPEVVVPAVSFPNCMTLDEHEDYLYVVRTVHSDVVRYRLGAGGRLGPEERCTPRLGGRLDEEFGASARDAMSDPATMRRWGMADGCGFDAEGNLWVTLVAANRVVAVTPEGQVVTVVDDPAGTVLQSPTSVAWGGPDGRDVYFGSLSAAHLVKGRSTVAGMVRKRAASEEGNG